MKKTRTEYDPNATSEQLDNLKTSKCMHVRCAVASHPNTSPETLLFLAYDRDSYVVEYVAENKNSPKEALEVVYNNGSVFAKRSLVSHPNTPVSLHHKLMIDDDPEVRIAYYEPSSRFSILELAKGIVESWLNEPWPTHKNASPKSLGKLSSHSNPLFRLALALYHKTPKYWVENCLHDDNIIVVEAAMMSKKTSTFTVTKISTTYTYEDYQRMITARRVLLWKKYFNRNLPYDAELFDNL